MHPIESDEKGKKKIRLRIRKRKDLVVQGTM